MTNNPAIPGDGDGFPAQTAYLERYLGGFVGNSYETFSTLTGEHGMSAEVSSEDLEWVLEVLENTPPPSTFLYSGVVYDILFDEIGSCIAGDKTADKVMDIIQRMAGLYLSENY